MNEEEMVAVGRQLFADNCVHCHGEGASGSGRQGQGPPPLDGSGHVTHHPPGEIRQVIKEGRSKAARVMPAFGKTLTEEDISCLFE